VPILYEGRTAEGFVKDAPGLDQLFEDLFRDYTSEELAVIKAKYATEGDVLEAPLLIEQKASDMIRHYASVVLPEGFKAQVVATSRQAAVTYVEKLEQARRELVAELEALPAGTLALPDEEVEKLEPGQRFLVRVHPQLAKLRALEIAAVFSGDHNDPESWWEWADKGKQEDRIKRFKRKLAVEKSDKTDPLSTDGKAGLLKAFQDATAVVDSSGLCLFTTFAWSLEDIQPQIDAACEGGFSLEKLLQIGERVWNLERDFNLRAGFTAKDDTLPPRLLKDGARSGPAKGLTAQLDKMLPEYYQLRGWTKDGVPSNETRARLGL